MNTRLALRPRKQKSNDSARWLTSTEPLPVDRFFVYIDMRIGVRADNQTINVVVLHRQVRRPLRQARKLAGSRELLQIFLLVPRRMNRGLMKKQGHPQETGRRCRRSFFLSQPWVFQEHGEAVRRTWMPRTGRRGLPWRGGMPIGRLGGGQASLKAMWANTADPWACCREACSGHHAAAVGRRDFKVKTPSHGSHRPTRSPHDRPGTGRPS